MFRHLFKTLGATSKLLTESITERISNKTKGAKHKIDKMHKSSRERIAETTKSATNKLKNVGKNLHERIETTTNNLSLGRSHKRQNNNHNNRTMDINSERSQNAQPNDELFQSISFHSPISSQTNNKCMNINPNEASYEIPKNLRSISSDLNVAATTLPSSSAGAIALPPYPPSYDDIIKEDTANILRRRHVPNEEQHKEQPRPTVRTKNLADKIQTEISTNLEGSQNNPAHRRTESPSSNSSNESEDNNSSLRPNFPPPILKSEGIYGKIKPKDASSVTSIVSNTPLVTAPVRTKRCKDYEQAEIRPKTESSIDSTRATIDSNEYRTTATSDGGDRFPKIFSRDLSADFSDKIRLDEKQIPKPTRSDSWSYYDVNDDQSDGSSTPEPIYANDNATRLVCGDSSEPVYGVLYNTESPESTLLTPQAASRRTQCESQAREQKRHSNRPGCSTDILKEFDPLDANSFDKIFSSKSNELILLEMETLLGEETYGPAANEYHFEYHSTEPSDEEDAEIPAPPQRLDSLPEAPDEVVVKRDTQKKSSKSKAENEEERRTVIIHQNSSLRSDSLENIVNETNIEHFLTKSNEKSRNNENIDLSRPTPSKSKWFLGNVDAMKNVDNEKIINKIDDKHQPKSDKCPPPYSEVLAELEATAASTSSSSSASSSSASTKPTTPTMSDRRSTSSATSSAKSSVKSMFSNVISKMEGIKRKASFRGQGGKPEVRTIIEMIPRPCLTQRLTLHEGHLIRLPTGVVEDILKEIHSRKAYIRDKKFQAYCDKDIKTPKENISLEHITTIQCVSNHKFTNHSVDMYCFEITTAVPKNNGNNLSHPNMVMSTNSSGNTKIQRTCHLYAVAKESERFIWMQKLLDSLTDVFPAGFSCKFYRAGWCYLKVILNY